MNWLYSHWAYATILLFSVGGLLLADYRYHLVVWKSHPAAKRAALVTIGLMVSFFIIWDIAGIVLGIFYTNPRFTLGLNIVSPNLPIEEFGFLVLLTYSVLILDEALQRNYQQIINKAHHFIKGLIKKS